MRSITVLTRALEKKKKKVETKKTMGESTVIANCWQNV